MDQFSFAFVSDEQIDLNRLERGLALEGVPVGDGRWRMDGGREPHWVDLKTPNTPRCDCGDHLWREATCKHILAALLREGHPRVIAAVGQLVQSLRASASEGWRRHRASSDMHAKALRVLVDVSGN